VSNEREKEEEKMSEESQPLLTPETRGGIIIKGGEESFLSI